MARLGGLVLFLIGMVCAFAASAQATCPVKIGYTVQSSGKSSDIFLQLKDGEAGAVTAELYDLYKGKIVAQKKLFLSREPSRVFVKASPSTYVIYIKTDQCKRPIGLGGLEGIKIGDQ